MTTVWTLLSSLCWHLETTMTRLAFDAAFPPLLIAKRRLLLLLLLLPPQG
jgi:hypothetical protein